VVPSAPAPLPLTAVRPLLAVPGARVSIEGGPFPVGQPGLPEVRVGAARARILLARSNEIAIQVPADAAPGRQPIRLDAAPGAAAFLDVAAVVATGIHQVDNPAIDTRGNVYLTCSGSRGQQSPVSVYRVRPTGLREVFVTGITNATSLAFGPDGRLYVSSRFDGTVARVDEEGRAEVVATDLGVACGIAFGPEGELYVGDRGGAIFVVDLAAGETRTLATLPASVAAFHLAVSPQGDLFVTGPTLASHDRVYRIDREGRVETFAGGFGRPQGLAFDRAGRLHVVEALAGACGLYRLGEDGSRELVASAPALVGAAFDARGGLVLASNETAWRFDAA
jgi:sugar lactone lactonase YvrE